MERRRLQVMSAVIGSLAVIAVGCGSGSGLAGPSPAFSAGRIEMAPAGAIVGTAVTLECRGAFNPAPGSLSYSWDFGDGSTASGEVTSHVYTTAGVFMAAVTVHSDEAGSAATAVNIPVRSLTGEWSGDYGRVAITQEGLLLRGTSADDSRPGMIVGGSVSPTGTVTFTITNPDVAPVTFTGTAGPDVMTLVGAANGRGAVDRRVTLTRE